MPTVAIQRQARVFGVTLGLCSIPHLGNSNCRKTEKETGVMPSLATILQHGPSDAAQSHEPRSASSVIPSARLALLNPRYLATCYRRVRRLDNFNSSHSILTRRHGSAAFTDGPHEIRDQEQVIVFTPAELSRAHPRIAV